ncbi:putative odorant receptor 83c [Tribolium madens]|uniref:putative odorant receptor 83c n=1 Tax=Tribolium madens TaxID=41895 RepID=UPI001CF73270|nr:putative odorant receptor 83c [Tribolium madens]
MTKKFLGDDISADPLKMLWLGQLHPFSPSRRSFPFLVTNLGACWLMMGLAIKGIVISYKTDIFFVAECLQTCNLMFHGIGKFLNLYFHKTDLQILLKKRSQFWEIDDFEIHEKLRRITFIIKKILRYYFCLVFVVIIFFDLQPFATGMLPTGGYIPEGWFPVLTLILWFLSVNFFLLIQGSNGFFYTLSVSLIMQFKLLNHRFRKLRAETELKKLVDYHNFLTLYCQQLNKAFAPIFLLQFFTSITSASLSIFIFMQPGAWTNRIKFILYYLYTLVETSFYCIPAEILVNAASEIGEAVYDLNWYEIRINRVKKFFVIILARTQRTMVFSGYGLVNMNLQTFIVYLKTVFSFYTYLNSVRKIEK